MKTPSCEEFPSQQSTASAAFLKGVKNRDRLAEPYRPNLNDSTNEERSTSIRCEMAHGASE